MRIVHFSDLHIGVENHGRVDPATGLSTRLLDFLAALDELVEYSLSSDVDLVVLAGDAYKGRDPSQTHQRELARRLAKLSSAGIAVFLLVGNHDLPAALGRATAVDIFDTLQVSYVQVGDDLATYTMPTKKGPVQIVGVPWPKRSGLLSREQSRSLSLDQVRERLEELCTSGIERETQKLDPELPAILTAHVTINGSTVGSERSMMLGHDHALFPSAVHKPSLDYVALGHIHKHQILRHDPMVVYSGSLQRVDFSEEKDTKGFCVIDLDPSAPQGKRVTDFRFQQVDARPFVTIEARINPGDLNPTQTVINAIQRQKIAGSILRVRITTPPELDVHLSESDIRQALSPAHYVTAISREVDQPRRTRIPAAVAEGLSPMDALKMYLESRGTDAKRQETLLTYAGELITAEEHSEEG